MIEVNKIYNEDCRELLKRMDSESVDLFCSDMPYEITHHGSTGTGGILGNSNPHALSGKIFEHNEIKPSDWLPEVYRVMKEGTHAYIMVNGRNLKDLWIDAEKVGFKYQNLLVWHKTNTQTPNKFYMQCLEFILMLRKGKERWINNMGMSNCLSIPNIIGKGGEDSHPTAKPIYLMRTLIEQSSNKGDLVLDPFMGGVARHSLL